MVAVDNVAIPAEENYVPFDDLLLHLSAQKVVDRLLRFLDARNIKKDGLFLRIVIELLDEKCSVLKPFIPAPLASQFHKVLRGGQINFVQRGNLKNTTPTQRFALRYRMDSSVTVKLTLWDDVAPTLPAHVYSDNTINYVILVITVNPNMFGGNLYLNSTSASRFFFDTNINPIQDFTKRMRIKIGEAFALPDRSAGILKKELVYNNQHNKFIYKADEQTEDADFLCTTKVLCVLQNRFVVPHNLHIQTKYKAHINIEWCNKSSAIKNLFKYISKGMDGANSVIRKEMVSMVKDLEMVSRINQEMS